MKDEIVLYRPNEQFQLEVQLKDETVWLTQQQIADLFGVKQPAVSKHLSNIFREGELDKNSVHSILEYTAADGKVYSTQFYNLDAILSVGYRVNSKNYTKNISRQLSLDFEKHNAQYSPIEVKQFDRAHDRFLCIDDTVYLIGASLKDLGKKWFGFVKLEQPTDELLSKM